jgi:hypothetical protein
MVSPLASRETWQGTAAVGKAYHQVHRGTACTRKGHQWGWLKGAPVQTGDAGLALAVAQHRAIGYRIDPEGTSRDTDHIPCDRCDRLQEWKPVRPDALHAGRHRQYHQRCLGWLTSLPCEYS